MTPPEEGISETSSESGPIEEKPAIEAPPERIPSSEVPPPTSLEPLSPSDERTWAMLAHLSILLNLVTGFLGPVAALVIYLVYKDRSRYVAYQSLQSILMQLIAWVGAGVVIGAIWLVTAALSLIIIGILLIPFAILGTIIIGIVPIASLVYGVYAAIQCNQGADFRYWLVGDWVRSAYEPASP